VLLLAGMLLAASRLGDSFFATPGAPAVDGTNPIALLLPLLRWRSVAWQAMRLVVDALADGFVVAFLYGAACGRASPVKAASLAVSRLPSLVGAEAIVGAIFVAPFVALVAVGSHASPHAATFALQIYLAVRLIFWREVIVMEAAGLARASRRSWNLVRRNWWRLAFLAAVGSRHAARAAAGIPVGARGRASLVGGGRGDGERVPVARRALATTVPDAQTAGGGPRRPALRGPRQVVAGPSPLVPCPCRMLQATGTGGACA